MKTINNNFDIKLEIKKSIFKAYLCPFDIFKQKLDELKHKHIKANHIVYAYRYLNDFNQIIEDKNDDKEPKNTSGMSALRVLRSKELINIAVIIIRYFGGIKLGIGGLIRAYSNATNEVISKAILQDYEIKNKFALYSPFNTYSQIKYFLDKKNIDHNAIFSDKNIKFIINTNQSQLISLNTFLTNFNNLDLRLFSLHV